MKRTILVLLALATATILLSGCGTVAHTMDYQAKVVSVNGACALVDGGTSGDSFGYSTADNPFSDLKVGDTVRVFVPYMGYAKGYLPPEIIEKVK